MEMESMRYNFRLEKVLNYKEKVEDIKKAEHMKANSVLRQEETKLVEYKNYKYKLVEEKDSSTSKKNINQMILFNNYLNTVNKGIESQKEVVFKSQVEVDKTKEELIFAMQEKKGFEKLKEKDFNEFLIEEKKKEDKIMDEIVTFKSNSQE